MTATVPSRDELQDHRPSGASQGPRPAPMFELIPYEKFRDTPSVRFFDITVPTSNKRDLVVHSGPAVSPPDCPETGSWQFYLHPHQEDNLLAMHGGRTFFLVNLGWNYPYHIVRLDCGGDILRIPPARSTAPSPIPMAPWCSTRPCARRAPAWCASSGCTTATASPGCSP